VPVLVIVTFCGALVVFMTWFVKVSLVGDNVMVDAAKEKSEELTRTQARNKTARFTSASGGSWWTEELHVGLGVAEKVNQILEMALGQRFFGLATERRQV